ncbi:MAG: hypothetical protein ACI37Q_01220 [Candidatus Gastranaerophilaceae bacterium]
MEIRNVTPNYTNRQPAFGMALRAPKDMGEFTDYVTKKGRVPLRMAKRGLERIKNAGGNHYDIEYAGGKEFNIIPVSDKAKAMELPLPEVEPDYIEKLNRTYFSNPEALEDAKGMKAAWLVTKKFAAAVRGIFYGAVKPESLFSSNLKKAVAQADAMEKMVEKQIAADAKAAAKKEKAVQVLSSVFDDADEVSVIGQKSQSIGKDIADVEMKSAEKVSEKSNDINKNKNGKIVINFDED